MLLCRPSPIPNESSRGYVLRLSEQNGLESPRWLLSHLEAGGMPLKGYLALNIMLNQDEIALAGMRGPIANLAQLNAPDREHLPIRYWNTRRPRFCPCCLAESAHWRATWDLVFTVACHNHGHRLHDQCPRCHEPLSWDRTTIAFCQCGFDLRQAASAAAAPGEVQMAREIELRLRPSSSQNDAIEVIRALELEALLKLVWFLGAYSRNAHHKPQKIVGLETIEIARAMVKQAMEILSEWPKGLHRLLDEIVARQKPDASSNKLRAQFGGFYLALYRSFPGPEFEFLRQGFEGYLREHWTGQLAKRNRRLSDDVRSKHEWLSIIEAAKLLKVRVGKVKQYLSEGMLEGQLHVTGSGRSMGAIRRESVEALATRMQDYVTLKEARALLGTSRKRAYALLEQGVLRPISGPTVDGQTLWRFQRQDILAFNALKT